MAIDRTRIVNDLSQLRIKGNAEGLIPAYGVFVQQAPASFWNSFSHAIIEAAGEDLQEVTETLLENAAAECGYHTGYGIITSEEFEAVIGPMIEKVPEDVLHGLYGVFTTWGWANAEIVELVPDQKMVVRAYNYYEADEKGVKRPFAFMVRGISRASMDLAYGERYPNGLGKFKCVQTKAIECGDPYGEFVVTRA